MNYSINESIKILVIGDIMLDHYIYGNCNRISPEAPVPVVEVSNESYTLGGAGNVLKNIRSLNCQADIVSVIGNDDNATVIIDHLLSHGIDSAGLIKDNSRCTTIKSRVLVANHQLIRLDREITKPVSNTIANNLLNVIRENVNKYDIVLLSDYNKGLLTEHLLEQVFKLCKDAGIKTILDPKGLDFKKYQGVNVIKPNKKEAIAATGIEINDRDSLEAACKKIKQLTGCDDVIITMSEKGMAFYSGAQLEIIPTKALDVVDVTGAGDTVLASLGVALAAGHTLYEACDFANHAAAVVVSKVGSATATLKEIYDKSII
jgi:rfaE bifunctional protein kinase chain/domain